MSDPPNQAGQADAALIFSLIESLKAGCRCVPHGLPLCNDRGCPNSPEWGGLIQLGLPPAILTAGQGITREDFETWQRTAELRWVPQDASHAPRFMLEQAWRDPDGRVEWRVVPKICYGGAPDTGR